MKKIKFNIKSLTEWIESNVTRDYPVFETIIVSQKGYLFLQREEEGPVDKIMCVKNSNKPCGRWCLDFQKPVIKSAAEIIIDYPFDRSLCKLKLCGNRTLHSWYVVDPSSDDWAEPEDYKKILKQIEGE